MDRSAAWVALYGLLTWGTAPASAEPAGSLAAAEVALTEGIKAFNHERYEEAAQKFQESLDHVDRASARHWLGLALLRLGREQEARTYLSEAELTSLRNGEAPRESLPPVDQRPLWQSRITLASGFDSNPSLLSEELSLPPAPGETPISGKDSDAVAGLDLRAAYHPLYRPDGWSAQVNLAGRQSFYRDLDFLDLGEVGAAVHFVRGRDPLGHLSGPLGAARAPFGHGRFGTLLQAGVIHYELGDEAFLRVLEAAASLTVRPRREPTSEAPRVLIATRIALDFQDREFFGEHRARTGEQLAIEVSEIFRFQRSGLDLRLTAIAGDRDAGAAFAESFLAGSAEVLVPIALGWTLGLSGGWRRDEFDHPQSNLFAPADPPARPRKDETMSASVALSWDILPRLRWTARATYAERDSSVQLGPSLPDLGYRRTMTTMGLGWTF